MAFTLFGRTLTRVAVIGSGNIGPDIALFLSRALVSHGVPVVVTDVVQSALDGGRERTAKKLEKGVEAGVFSPAEAEVIGRNIAFTLDKSMLLGATFVIEAATEQLEVKRAIFEELERLVPAHAILASNSSHLEPGLIFEKARRPERALVHHFFFPAERNPLVEVVPGPKTTVTDWCLKFYEALGKVPIRVKERYGYAIDPIFEGLFLAAALIAERGLPPKIIDAIACRALGLGVGPFTAMNLTGGNPLTQAGLARYHDAIMPWFRSPASLDKHVATGKRWAASDKGETLSYSGAMFDTVSRELLGAWFGLSCEVLESGISNLGDLDMAVELGLVMKAPFTLMNELGPRKVRDLVWSYAEQNPGFKVPRDFGPWRIPVVIREDHGDVAVLTLKRPRTLNALNLEVYRQLDSQLAVAKDDPKIRGVVITGFGSKAFASGADLSMLTSIASPQEAVHRSAESNRVMLHIERLGKPVIAALNGLSLGGGSELAYACTARVARKGVATLFGQPEVKLGIIPGAGGSQRLPRLIDFAAAWRLLRTGGSLSGEEALRLGLILQEVEEDVVGHAVEFARVLQPQPLPEPHVPATLPEVDLGSLSRKVDEILRKAILLGATLPMDKALEFESQCFGEVFATRDCRIGLENFFKTSLKQPAAFIHS